MKKPFYTVWNPDGSVPVAQHPSFESAFREAQRLGHTHRGVNFYILKAVKRVRVPHKAASNDNPAMASIAQAEIIGE